MLAIHHWIWEQWHQCLQHVTSHDVVEALPTTYLILNLHEQIIPHLACHLFSTFFNFLLDQRIDTLMLISLLISNFVNIPLSVFPLGVQRGTPYSSQQSQWSKPHFLCPKPHLLLSQIHDKGADIILISMGPMARLWLYYNLYPGHPHWCCWLCSLLQVFALELKLRWVHK